MHYFAYGSNMSIARLRNRVPSAKRLGRYRLESHDLRFHKCGGDGSGKCDAFYTGNREHQVIGVLYHIDPLEKPALDRAEGLGVGYGEKQVVVVGPAGELIEANTYWAMMTDPQMKPFTWYLNHVLVGAHEVALPAPYVDRIRLIESVEDPDRERDALERAIHGYTVGLQADGLIR
ncbi:hypothetical protein GCM10011352_30060 [Marinobacterium zhoushanense]|uniref:AIG2 family protein n=2 Tax=Marinobacterium zhoushanense TaxID=1679163 RepID=A0ABQ1KJ01_9GAMM|nr:hypothetical protein GCM10011352_30060 [Marinobacterium zhoushanense]